ncbi:hypothetical protein H5410_025133 [Solanum commersonii]|uniref:F-box domain-containing protein n=1 Tax=Solanum commersonii TaxID=4109 RepID=A0A9J5YSX4_SOLCO|nr:hypothetical protein H5410_025133 [Solanum commersonii]
MEGKKRPLSPFQDTQTNQKRCRRITTEEMAHDDMVFEILTLLPAKSLVRFICVSKAWNILIRHDLNFANARSRARLRLLFEVRIKTPSNPEHYCKYERFPLQLVGPRNYFNHKEISICSNYCNGLICLYYHKESQGYLYNITTGEIKAFPFPIFSLGYRKSAFARLYLGYDPATEKYKLLFCIYNKKRRPCIKILTLGTNSWRRICENSTYKLYNYTCTFLNGVLYWIHHYLSTMTYFNFTDEKFGTLSLPQKSEISKIQTALWEKLILHPPNQPKNCNLVYDEVNKVFNKFDSNPELVKKKVAFLEAENIDKRTKDLKMIFATSSLISSSTYLVFPYHFAERHVSRFVENIIPLKFIIDV